MNAPVVYYVHIGLPKTGTSSLQHFFKQNFDQLIEKGCLYPKAGRNEFDHHSQMRFSATDYSYWVFYYFFKLSGIKYPNWFSRSKSVDELKKELSDEVTRTQARSVVISSEWLSILMTKNSIKRFADVFGENIVRPVIYIRRQDEAIQSLYAELIKGNSLRFSFKFNYSALIRIPFFNYYNLYTSWARVFGKENIIIRTYDQLHQNDIRHDFLSILSLDNQGLSFNAKIQNSHLSTNSIHTLRKANKKGLSKKEFIDLVERLSKEDEGEKGFNFLTPQEFQNIFKHFELSNKKLALEYFNREQLFL